MSGFRHALHATLALALLAGGASAAGAPAPQRPPATRVAVVRDTLHGVVIEDPYRWLEDRDSPETRQWVRDQMAYTTRRLAEVPDLERVKAALGTFVRAETRSLPQLRHGRLFFTARRADQQQAVLVTRDGADAPDRVLVDPNPMSPDRTTSVALLAVSHDGGLVAYGLRHGGEDETDVRLVDAAGARDVPGGLPKARYLGLEIDGANRGCWYARWEPEGSRVRYHRFGDDVANDAVVFDPKLGPAAIPTVALSPNGRWLLVGVSVGASGDDTRWFLRAAASDGPFVSVTDTLHARVRPVFAGDTLLLQTQWNAPNGRVMFADAHAPQLGRWRELAGERRDAVLQGVAAVGGRVALSYLRDVASQVIVTGFGASAQDTLGLPGLGTASGPAGEWDAPGAFYAFASLNRPTTIYRYDVAERASRPWWSQSPSGFDPDRYDVRQVWYSSTVGARVPMFIVQPKTLVYDGSHPVLMTGYGGFEISETPAFSALAAAWLEMGGVYVLTNLRGGSEFGEKWHRDGMLANKQHTFDDFANAARYLITHGYCTPRRLGITGGSNGGLLVGAAMTQHPELFGAVVCQVPLLDMLRYHRFLIARFWVPEYGSSDDSTQFAWLRAYSPYHHVRTDVDYPGVMFVSGDSDTRVDPMHARKMAARIQAVKGDRPALLHYDVGLGHSAGKSVDKTIEDDADVLQFLRWQLGMTELAP